MKMKQIEVGETFVVTSVDGNIEFCGEARLALVCKTEYPHQVAAIPMLFVEFMDQQFLLERVSVSASRMIQLRVQNPFGNDDLAIQTAVMAFEEGHTPHQLRELKGWLERRALRLKT
jgi:hypothetical protein